MKKNLKNLDFLIYFSYFISLMLILLLLTSSKNISYDIEEKVKIDDQGKLNINAFITDTEEITEDKKESENNFDIIAEEKKVETDAESLIIEKIEKIKKKVKENKAIIRQAEKKIEKKKIDKIIKAPIKEYIVKSGDNLWRISLKFNTDIKELIELNNIKNPNIIHIGQKIRISSKVFDYNIKIKGKTEDYNKINKKISAQNKKSYRKKFKFIWSLKGRISSEFGVRHSPYNRKKMEFHPGIDIANKIGKDFTAAERGKVIFNGIRGGYGKTIIIQHRKGYKTIYGHALITFVQAGQYVEKGQIIGRVGNTGISTGPHLHFEIRRNNVALDPTTLINKRFLFYY